MSVSSRTFRLLLDCVGRAEGEREGWDGGGKGERWEK